MKITLAMITVLVALTACTTQTIALSEHEQRLQWVTAADGRQDAQKALLEGDFRLMAIGGRGIVIPASIRSSFASTN